MPARWVPLLYFAFAHVWLGAAFAALAFQPRSLVGFFYHPRMLAVVHLVTLGWISASILGAVYVIGPLAFRMPLPARRADYLAFAGFALGVAGMAGHFFAGGRGLGVSAALVVAGNFAFLSRVVWMLRNRRPAPTDLRRPDWGVGHALQALVYLVLASGLGLYLALAERSETTLALASAYGALGLVGFLSQIIVGVEGRVLPLFAWLWSFADHSYAELPRSLHGTPSRFLQGFGFLLWTAGVPLLALGLAREQTAASWGAGALLVAVLVGFANAVLVVWRLWRG